MTINIQYPTDAQLTHYGLAITSSKHELLEKTVNFNFIFVLKKFL